MGKTYVNAVKYEITATFKINGIVDKHDIIGAIFGQSEGLLGEELDLRELQKNGKIGRIQISHRSHGGNTTGKVVIPSSMDMIETSILAAAIETVDKVGPCKASFIVREIEDTRTKKRKKVVNRAQDLLEKMMREQIPESEEIAKKVKERVRVSGIQKYGRDNLPAGPQVHSSDSIIVVEGRADVLTLLKNNIKNVIGMDGSKISKTIVKLGKKKNLTVFIDGDRGGELILRKLASLTDVDYVARAPDGKEVEELSRKEIVRALRKKVPLTEALEKKGKRRSQPKKSKKKSKKSSSKKGKKKKSKKEKKEVKASEKEIKELKPVMDSLKGNLKAKIFDKNMKELDEVSVRNLLKSIKKHKKAHTIALDGIITKRLLEACEENNVKRLVGAKKGKIQESNKTKTIVIK